MTPLFAALSATTVAATTALLVVWVAVAVTARLCESDRPLERLAVRLAPARRRSRARLIAAVRAGDRALAVALVGLGRGGARALVTGTRATGAALVAAGRAAITTLTVALMTASRLTVAIAALAVAVAMAATLVPPTASALTGMFHVSNPNPEDPTEFAPLPERSRVLADDGTELARLHGEFDRKVVELAEIPPVVRAAVVAAEDRHFAEHDGFDPQGLLRAAWTNASEGRIEAGGSTITQQVAKANFTDGERTLDRKLVELRYARALEANRSKRAILERYLNEVYIGRGAYGVAAAAEAFFGRDVAHLEADQAALLAGMIAAPARFSPDFAPQRARARRNQVLEGMAEEGYLDPRRADLAATQPLGVIERSRATPRDPYVVEQAKRELLASPALGDTLPDRIDTLFEGGLTIHTSVDRRLQDTADELIAEAMGNRGPTAALLVMEADTGRIVATRSGQDFGEDQYDPALQGRRQPGSAFKAFVLATVLEQGMSLDDVVDASSPATLEFGGPRPWRVSNYANTDYGPLTVAEAFARSSNTAFARLILQAGQSSVEDMLGRLGIDLDRALGEQRGLSPAMALGGVRHGMTLPEMATAFGALTGDGRIRPAHVVTQVTDRDGEVLLQREPQPRRAVSPDVAAQTRQALARVVAEGTGQRAQLPGREVVGKTGTSQQFADAWFVGETERLVGAAWVGHPEGRIPMDRMTGGSVPAELWRDLMEATLSQRGAPQG